MKTREKGGLLILNSIQSKLRLTFLLFIFFSICGGILSFILLNKVTQYQYTHNDLKELVIHLQEARKAEKDFILFGFKTAQFLEDGVSNSLIRHHQSIELVGQTLPKLKNSEVLEEEDLIMNLDYIAQSIEKYQKAFEELVQIFRKRGFNDHGLEVLMRGHVHELQNGITDKEKVFAYMMRRHEKDFIMRKDQKYIKELFHKAEALEQFLKESRNPELSKSYKEKQLQHLDKYTNYFKQLVSLEREIGLSDQQGLMGMLSQRAKDIEPGVEQIQMVMQEQALLQYNNAKLVLFSTFALLLLIGILFNIYLTRTIAKPIIFLDSVIKSVIKGDNAALGKLKKNPSKDEIGSLIANFYLVFKNLREKMDEVSLKNKELEMTASQDAIRSWTTQGLASFVELLKSKVNLDDLCYQMISHLVKYTKSHQGGIYILEEDQYGAESRMVLRACHAFDRKKMVKASYEWGEGLVGACWRDKDFVLLTEVPDNYIHITSGLGHANPKVILIVPLIADDKVEGIIELASFNIYQNHEIEFIQKLAERIASTIYSVKMQDQTMRLLEASKKMTEEMSAAEEELRQNIEEMKAIQDESKRREIDLEARINGAFLRLEFYEKLMGKVYDGLIITDEKLIIRHINAFVTERLFYSSEDILDKPLALFLKAEIEIWCESLGNDPNYLVQNFSEQKTVKVFEKNGKTLKVKMVITQLSVRNERYYVFLFREQEVWETKKYLRKIEQRYQVNP